MGLYEGIKDVAKVVQQADNIELYRQLKKQNLQNPILYGILSLLLL